MKIFNPANNEVINEIRTDSLSSVQEKYNLALIAQRKWKITSLEDRIKCLSNFSKLLKENQEELAQVLTSETGKPINESRGEISGAIAKNNYFVENSEQILKSDRVSNDETTKEILSYDPLGVIVNISAWNYPYLVGINIFTPALICGNAVLYKPSEFASLTGEKIVQLLGEAGVPKDIMIGVYGEGDIGAALLELPIDGVFFTGSHPTGVKINQAVASKLIPVGLELGGKDPLYVTDQIDDLDQAAANAVEGAFYNNGQSCCSVERIYIHEKVYDQFISAYESHARKLKVGDPLDESNSQGAITRSVHLNFLQEQVSDATSKGATILCGGSAIESSGNFFGPTVLTNVDHTMSIMKDETFGPVIGLMKVSSDEEAIKLMNDTSFGLTSSVFTNNSKRGLEILSQINSGTGYLNCCDRVSANLPWSGRGQSGLGSSLSKHGVYAFCHPKGTHIR